VRTHVIAAIGVLLALTCAVTWPLAAHLTTSLPGDYGDPLFVTWVMGWVARQLTHALADPAALQTFWDANIFFPERGALAFSEHFVAQTVMVLPVYWTTGNLLLCYNVAFIATFVLTGLGTYLLARALTGSLLAAALAAFVVAFNEYRLTYEVAHLHVLSIHWLPFALLALWRYFETDRRRWLAAAAAALVALNLSSIYYMAYCAPFVAAFAIFAAATTGRWRQPRVWLELWAMAAAVALATVPFLLAYLEVQQRLAILRGPDELRAYSATLDHYRAALPGLAAPLMLGMLAVVLSLLPASRTAAATGDERPATRDTRRATRGASRGLVAFLLAMLGLAFWLSLGPVVQSGGQPTGWPGIYGVLHENVPGFNGLRVPARFAMLWLVFLGLLAACGSALMVQRSRAGGRVATLIAGVALLWTTPFGVALNQPLPSDALAPPPPYLTPGAQAPAIYRAVGALSPGAVLAEFPFGDPGYDLRYMYFSASHGRRLLNGYSGVFPPSSIARQTVLRQPLLDPPRAAAALSGATHIVVHRHGWKDNTGTLIGGWLEAVGATAIDEADGAVLYELPARENFARK
jgi:hypothetical protein